MEDVGGVEGVHGDEIDGLIGGANASALELMADLMDGGGGVMFDCADADAGFEDDDEKDVFVDVAKKGAVGFALLVDAGEIGFAEAFGNGLSGAKGTGGEGGDGGGVKLADGAALIDEGTAFVDDERGGGLTFAEQLIQGRVEQLNIFFDERWEAWHIRFCARFR